MVNRFIMRTGGRKRSARFGLCREAKMRDIFKRFSAYNIAIPSAEVRCEAASEIKEGKRKEIF